MARRTTFARLALVSLAVLSTACQLPVFFPQLDVNTSDDLHSADDVAIGKDGDFTAVWSESTGIASSEVVGRRLDRFTVPVADPFAVNADTTGAQLSTARLTRLTAGK